jgi:deoxyhypusine synthase
VHSEREGLRKALLQTPLQDLTLDEVVEKAGEALSVLEKAGGFSVRYLSRAADILLEALRSKCWLLLSFPANIVATGLRGLLADIVRDGYAKAVVTTGGTFDHDIARSIGGLYYVGDFELDDVMLHEVGVHRLGNVLVPSESYGPLVESFAHGLLEELVQVKETWSPSELAAEAGKRLADKHSILRACAESGTPVFAPGIIDSAFGTAIFTYNESARASSSRRKIYLDVVEDMERLASIVYEADCLAGLMLGGGISKHHVIWWAQFRGGLDYAVAITSAPEWDGSLSGARTREAISWGKVKPSARHVTVPGDVTVLFPILVASVIRRLREDRSPT